MNKAVLVMATALLAVAMLAVSVNTALAVTIYTDHEYAGANCVIDVPGHTMMRLAVYGQMYGDYYNGRAERIQIQVHTGQFTPAGLPVFKNVAAYEDNPTRSAFSLQQIALGLAENLVEPGQIQVLRVGESNTVMVHWNVPLVCPATGSPNPTPAVTLPPGKLVVRGYGEAISGSTPPTSIGPNNWQYSIVLTYYLASATLFCEGWDYKWLPVAQQFAGTTMEPRSVTDILWTWTHP